MTAPHVAGIDRIGRLRSPENGPLRGIALYRSFEFFSRPTAN